MSLEKIKTVTLADVSINNKGEYGIGASAVDYSDELYTYLRITDINDDGTLNKNDLKSVDDVDAKNYLLNENDVVFARTGNSTGKAYYYDKMDGELVYAGFLIKFSLDPSKINPKFMKYYVLSKDYKGWVNSMCTGSTRPNINAKMYGNMELILPPREQQDFLVNILGEIDNKIEINKRINKNLLSIADAIYKKEFQNFDSYSEDELITSDFGLIPKNWCYKTLDEISDVAIGKTPPRKETWWFSEQEGVKWVSIKDLGNSGTYIFETSEYLTKEAIEKFNVKLIPKDTVILSFKLTVGRIGITTEEMVTNEAIAHFKLSENSVITKEYLYLYLKNFNYEELGSTSSIAKAINSKIVKKIPILIPINKINEFKDLFENIFDKIKSNQLEINKLTKLRDTLLPKLMSGEIDVSKINCDLE